MLKTTFDQDGWEKRSQQQPKRKEAKGLNHRKKPSLAADDLAEILYLLQVKPEFAATQLDPLNQNRQNLWDITHNKPLNIAKNLSVTLFQAFGLLSTGRFESKMLWCKLFEDGCEKLQGEILDFERSNLSSPPFDSKTLQLRKLCDRIVLNIIEKKILFRNARLIKNKKTSNPRYLQALNKILDSTAIGKTFPLLKSGWNIILLERKRIQNTRTLSFLNELSQVDLKQFIGGRNTNHHHIATIKGMVVLNQNQNKIITNSSLVYSGQLGRGKLNRVCVDAHETNSCRPLQIAPYIAKKVSHELHGQHTSLIRGWKSQINKVSKEFSGKNCCGYVIEKNGKMFDLRIFENPHDFNPLARHFAEFLFGTFLSTAPTGRDIEINSQKINLPSPTNCWIEGVKIEDHGLSDFPIHDIDCLWLENRSKPSYMAITG